MLCRSDRSTRMAELDVRQLQSAAMTPHPTRDSRGARPAVAAMIRIRPAGWSVLVLTAILFFARLGARALWSSEFRWAEIAREMIVTHNYFWPTINGHVYYDKPLGSYWLVLVSTSFTGGLNESCRAPARARSRDCSRSALLMLLARRLYDARTAVSPAIILATSFSFVFFSRHASADVETIAGELAALLLFSHNEDRGGGSWVVGLWLIMAVTSLTKGLLGFALPLLVIGAYSCLRDGWSQLFRGTFARLARRSDTMARRSQSMVLQLVLVVGDRARRLRLLRCPFEISRAHDGLAEGPRDGLSRKCRAIFSSVRPSRADLSIRLRDLRPDGAVVRAAARRAGRRRISLRRANAEPARSDRFALVYFWATFIFFTLSGSRRSYYILPILPAAAMLVARMLAYPGELRSTIARRLLISRLRDRRGRRESRGIVAVDSGVGDSARAPDDAAADLPAKFAFIVFWIVIGRRGHLCDSQIQPVSRRDFDGRDRIPRDGLHLYLRDAGGGGVSRRKAVRLRGAEQDRRLDRPTGPVQDAGTAILSRSAQAAARVRDKQDLAGCDREGRRRMGDRPPARPAEARHSGDDRARAKRRIRGKRLQLSQQGGAA